MNPELIQVLQTINAVVVVLAVIGAPFFIVWGRKYFADRDAPGAVKRALREELAQMEARVRQELNNGLSSASAHSIQQYGSISTQLADVKRSMENALERAHAAHDAATAAIHKAERADDKITALDRLITTRLDHFSSQMRGIEELLKSQSSGTKHPGGRSA